MIKHNQDGAITGVGIALVFCIIFLIGAISFGGWAYISRQDYKDNVDAKIADAVTVAKQEESTRKDKEFVEKEKNPLRTYNGPSAYGSIVLQYPKTWSGLVDESPDKREVVDGYFYPNVVPSPSKESSTFAFRMQVVAQPYSEALQSLTEQQSKENPPKVTPFTLPKVPNVIGVKVVGSLPNEKTGEMIILPLRSQTLQIWTEGSQFTGDFNNILVPNISFSP
jgi:hypothetical protein